MRHHEDEAASNLAAVNGGLENGFHDSHWAEHVIRWAYVARAAAFAGDSMQGWGAPGGVGIGVRHANIHFDL